MNHNNATDNKNTWRMVGWNEEDNEKNKIENISLSILIFYFFYYSFIARQVMQILLDIHVVKLYTDRIEREREREREREGKIYIQLYTGKGAKQSVIWLEKFILEVLCKYLMKKRQLAFPSLRVDWLISPKKKKRVVAAAKSNSSIIIVIAQFYVYT